MFRRWISLLVIVGLVAGQLAAIPHAHGELSPDQQREHDAAPHLHFGLGGHHHGHSHHGHAHPHSTQRDSERSKATLAHSDVQLLGVAATGDTHDSDAVYVPHARGSSLTNNKDTVASAWQLAKTVSLATCPGASQPSARTFCWHPPDAVKDASDRYLILRNLRI